MKTAYRELMDLVLQDDTEILGRVNDWTKLVQDAYEKALLEGTCNALELGENRYKEKLECVKVHIFHKLEEERLHKTDLLFLPDLNVARAESLGECTWESYFMMH